MSSLKSMLAAVGREKDQARSNLSSTDGRRAAPEQDLLARAQASLALYEDLLPLRLSRLVAELGSEQAAREQLRAEAQRRALDREAALLKIQAQLYGLARAKE